MKPKHKTRRGRQPLWVKRKLAALRIVRLALLNTGWKLESIEPRLWRYRVTILHWRGVWRDFGWFDLVDEPPGHLWEMTRTAALGEPC